jgi:hypothetical protein
LHLLGWRCRFYVRGLVWSWVCLLRERFLLGVIHLRRKNKGVWR